MSRFAKIALILCFPQIVFAAESGAAVYNGKLKFRPGSNAEPYNPGKYSDVKDRLTEAAEYNSKVLQGCDCQLSKLPVSDPKCEQRYAKLFDKPEVNFKIAFGYRDINKDWSVDPYIREALVNRMKEPCPPNASARGQYVCGFKKENEDNADVWVRELNGKKFRFTVINSSYSPQASVNQANPRAQERQSQRAQNAFMDFCDTDVSIGVGHGRYGCGLGFFPPKWKKNELIDVDWECKNRKTMEQMEAGLTKCQPKLFSMFACKYPNVAATLKKAAPKTAYQSQLFNWMNDLPYQLYGTLNGLMGQVCGEKLNQLINPPVIDKTSEMKFSSGF